MRGGHVHGRVFSQRDVDDPDVARPRNSHDVHVAGRERGLDHKSGEVVEKRETYMGLLLKTSPYDAVTVLFTHTLILTHAGTHHTEP